MPLVELYNALGWRLVRLRKLTKIPVESGYKYRDPRPGDFRPGENVGILLGDPSGGLVDIDLDCPEAVKLAPLFLPAGAWEFARASGDRRHYLYTSPGTKTTRVLHSKIELRSTNLFTMAPPSVHKSGERVDWCCTPGTGPAVVSSEEITAAYGRLACATRIALSWAQIPGDRHTAALALAGICLSSGLTQAEAESLILPAAELSGPDTGHRKQAIADTYASPDANHYGYPTLSDAFGEQATTAIRKSIELITGPGNAREYRLNEIGQAQRLADLCCDRLRHCQGLGWLQWDGRRWAPGQEPWPQALETIEDLHRNARTDESARKYAHALGNTGKVRALIDAASHDPAIAITSAELDQDPWLLAVENGVIDLRTGELHEHSPDYLITRFAPIVYLPDAVAPRFLQFLDEAFEGDGETIGYVLRLLGYCLTGSTQEHVLSLWYGPRGANGKSTLLSLLLWLLGDYAGSVAPGLLLSKSSDQHPAGLLDLRGKRLVVCDETPDGKRWDEALVKRLTGGGSIKARALYRDFVEFDQTHKLVIATNSRPIVRDHGGAFWRRVRVLPWRASFVDRIDPTLLDKLKLEASGILNLLVAGARSWYETRHTNPSAAVREASDDYRDSQDLLAEFLEQEQGEPDDRVARSDLFLRYKLWSANLGEHQISATAFYRILEERGFKAAKVGGVRSFYGFKPARSGSKLRAVE